MYPGGWFWLGVVNLTGLIGLAAVLWKQDKFLKKLFPADRRGEKESFKDKLEELLAKVGELEVFQEKGLNCIQRVALKRYNPYRDTGGDQSFSAALLDGRGDGVVITSLHSRAGTRVFAKPVTAGKEGAVRLSREEEGVITEALQKG